MDRKQLNQRLTDPSPEVRRRAVAALPELELDGDLELVLAALADDDWRVRKETVAVLGRCVPSAQLIDALIDAAVQDEQVGLRNAAAEALSGMGAAAVDAIVERLPALDPGGRKIALETIGSTRSPRAAEALIDGLEDDDSNVRVAVAEWLCEQDGEAPRKALQRSLASDDVLLVLAALQSLNRMGARVRWELLEPLAAQPIFGAEILLALGRSGEPRAAQLILAQLAEEPSAVRALELLHAASDPAAEAVEQALAAATAEQLVTLPELATKGEPAVQRAAVKCLLWARHVEHVPFLIDLLRDESLYPLLLEGMRRWGPDALASLEQLLPRVQGRALASVVGLLARLLDPDSGRQKAALFSAYLNSSDLAVATAAAGAVARFGDEGVLDRLVELTGAEHGRVRRAATHALMAIGRRHPEAVRRMLSTLEVEGDQGIELCKVLEIVGRPEDASLLASALSSPDARLRRAVIGALAVVAGAGALDSISLAMTDEDTEVRMAAAAALAQIGPAASETIVTALHAATGPLRAALVSALGRVGHREAPAILRTMCRGTADVALAALGAIHNLDLDPGEIQEEILGHTDAEVVKQALASLGDAVLQNQLIKLIAHRAWDVRLAAVDRLAGRELDATAKAALAARLEEEPNDLVGRAIGRLLGQVERFE